MKRLIALSLLPVALIAASVSLTVVDVRAHETEGKAVMPATSAGIWREVDHHIADLHATVEKGELDKVHVHAYAIRDLVRTLPAHSPKLSAEALAKIKAQSKFVDTLAARLDEAGDAGDKAATIAGLTKLEGVLKSIRAQYPEPQ